jgi:CPA2 family monovalent cation:H+ antiporter-2
LVLVALGLAPDVGLILGLCVAMSSSVVIVNITRSRARRTNKHTETALLGWSLLQDLTGVVVAALLLAVWGAEARPPADAILALGLFFVLAVVAAQLFPIVLARLRDFPDLFLLVSIAAGLLGAGIGSVIFDIPLALAAFVAGLVVAEGPISAEARRRLLPFRDVFAVLFFVAVGSLLEIDALFGGVGWVAIFLALMVVTKTAVVYVFSLVGGLERPSQMAVGLSQMGEFSFVLVSMLFAAGAVTPEQHAGLLAVITLTIGGSAVAARAPVKGWVRGHDERGAAPVSSAAGTA